LQGKIAQLVEDLEHAQAAAGVADAGQELMAKKELDGIRSRLQKDLDKAGVRIDKLTRQLDSEVKDVRMYEEEIESLQRQHEELSRLNEKLQSKAEKFSEAAGKAADMKDQLMELSTAYKDISEQFDFVNVKYKEEQKIRKRLLNELEDIKGKVRCYARIRPFSKTELKDSEKRQSCVDIHDDFSMSIKGLKGRDKKYAFDAVYGAEST